MSLWREFTNTFGFNDGADEMMIHRLIRDRTVELLNDALQEHEHYVFAAYDRPGLHNSCLIIGGTRVFLKRDPLKDTMEMPFENTDCHFKEWPSDVQLDEDMLSRLADVGYDAERANMDPCAAITRLASSYVNHELYEAAQAVKEIRDELWVCDDGLPAKEWDSDTPDNISQIMTRHGFGNPEEAQEEEE